MSFDRVAARLQTIEGRVHDFPDPSEELPPARQERLAVTFLDLRAALDELRVIQAELQAIQDELQQRAAAQAATEQRVDAQHERYHELFRLAPDAYLVTDSNGLIQEANRAAAELLHLEPGALVGKPFALFVAQDEQVAFRSRLLQLGRQAQRQEWTAHLVARGQPLATVAFTVAAVGDARAAPPTLAWLLRDVTTQRQTEAEQTRLLLRAEAAEAQLAGLLESAPDAIVIARPDGRISLINQQTELLFGYRRAELIDQPVEVLIPEQLRAAHVQHRTGYVAAPRTRPMGVGLVLYGRRKDGTEFPIEVSLSPMESEGERLVIAVVRDVSERRQAEEALQQLKDEFLANVTHDLKTPLAAIKASVGVVLANEPPGTSEPLHRMLTNIDLAADRMTSLIGDLLDLAHLQAGRVELRLDAHDVVAIAQRAMATIDPLVRAREQRLVAELPEDQVPALVDAERLGRVVLNLLSNACKYGRAGGHIWLRLEQRPDEVLLAVVDDGPGIAQAEQERIFERFYRSDGEQRRSHHGSGLGLPIARAIVELHGGRLWVESRPEAGATFWVALPHSAEGKREANGPLD